MKSLDTQNWTLAPPHDLSFPKQNEDNPSFNEALSQLTSICARSLFISCDPVLSTHPYQEWRARESRYGRIGGSARSLRVKEGVVVTIVL